ncbi:hypothetical protein E7Z59_06890 [Robertkochia marina]|uniref:Uncharacterized protein n=1 Tax=Robertkochia marina TaxID=1227945 RepID=A0A4S3LZ60_9FLAO|nr:hypothetical protein [Robertkochia marina]THD67382.1 hypothetical protein E7Z59_06890 [Robertkochia marina]TRZ43036.1 hypothetical protein D3A96_11195 [Robertkochia marina]
MKSIFLIILFTVGFSWVLRSQAFQLDKLGKEKWLKYRGSFHAGGMWYEGPGDRDPFGYLIQGNLQITVAGMFHIPFSFTYTDQEFRVPSPLRLNRFSLSPSYKNIRFYLGDAAMSFMPFTLNGHQFTGGGLEWQGNKGWLFSAMYGRLLKAVPWEPENPSLKPVAARFGYGVMTGYARGKWHLKGSLFTAKDKLPDESVDMHNYPLPEQNLALGFQGRFTFFKNGTFLFDLGRSEIFYEESGLVRLDFLKVADSLQYRQTYKALKLQLNYPALRGGFGVVYERTDPGYRTFGAYFFNADFENVHLTVNQSLFKGRVQLGLRAGVQRDNLDGAKNTTFRRLANAVNLNYKVSDNLNGQLSYSGFKSITNTRNQFDVINGTTGLESLDTLNYRQISQQAGLMLHYDLPSSSGPKRSFMVSANYQGNQQGEPAAKGNHHFYQGSLSYRYNNPEKKLHFSSSLQASINQNISSAYIIMGPGTEVGKYFLEQRLRARFGISYNFSHQDTGLMGNVLNMRAHAAYRMGRGHSVNLSGNYQYRHTDRHTRNDMTIRLQYGYTFDNFRIDLSPDTHTGISKANTITTLKFKYRYVLYSGTIPEINQQIALVSREPVFLRLPPFVKADLELLKSRYITLQKKGPYKFHALNYLTALYTNGDLLEAYYNLVDRVIRKLIHDMKKTDLELERRYVIGLREMQEFERNGGDEKIPAIFKECRDRLRGHRWLEEQLRTYDGIRPGKKLPALLKTYIDAQLNVNFRNLSSGVPPADLEGAAEVALIDHCYTWSLQHTKNRKVALRYHQLKP